MSCLSFQGHKDLRPVNRETRKTIRKTTNRTHAIHAAVPAIPEKPKMAAIIARIRNTIAQDNMFLPSPSWLLNFFLLYIRF